MKNLLILLLISSFCQAQVRHLKMTDADRAYIISYNFEKMNEPELYRDTSNNESYRFIWIRSFHHPLIVRIEKSPNAYNLYWKRWNGEGGYSWGKVDVDEKKSIDQAIWLKFIEKLHRVNFMKMPVKIEGILGFDGATWVLEGKTATTYHVVDRWSEGGSKEFYDCCKYLISLTGIDIPAKDIY